MPLIRWHALVQMRGTTPAAASCTPHAVGMCSELHTLQVACAIEAPQPDPSSALQATVSKDLQLMYILWTALDGPDKQIGKQLHSVLRSCCS